MRLTEKIRGVQSADLPAAPSSACWGNMTEVSWAQLWTQFHSVVCSVPQMEETGSEVSGKKRDDVKQTSVHMKTHKVLNLGSVQTQFDLNRGKV